jgi:hypothetical protein
MRGEHTVRQQFAKPAVRPAVHDEPRHEMEVRAGVDVVGDASRDDAEDRWPWGVSEFLCKLHQAGRRPSKKMSS